MRPFARATLTGLFALCFALAAARSTSRRDEASAAMAGAAKVFLDGLDPAQRARVQLEFQSPARTDWHFVPRERKGLALGDLDAADRAHFDALLSSGLSAQGRAKFDGVLRLEKLLREIESRPDRPALHRDPAKYHVAIFGTPGVDPWSWRVEGHHWTVHFTSVDAGVIGLTPSFVGANPSRVKGGPDDGYELLAGEDARALAFVASLKSEQRLRARLAGETPQDVLLDPSRARLDGPVQGICAKDLELDQRKLLLAVVDGYFADLTSPLCERERARFAEHPLERLYFAWSSSGEPERPWYWRVQGEYFAIEFAYLNGDGGHAHRIWRDFERDLGGDALREHLRNERK